MMSLNLAHIRAFIKFFSVNQETDLFTWAYFDEASGAPLPGCGTISGTPLKLISEIEAGLGNNVTVHLLINAGDGRGRKAENITGIRAFFVDLDTPLPGGEIKAMLETWQPHMVVRSSYDVSAGLGKYHLYWKADSRLVVSRWSVYQRGIAGLLSGDPNSSQPTKLMRIPGIVRRMKGSGRQEYTPELIVCSRDKEVIDPRAHFPGVVGQASRLKRQEKRIHSQVLTQVLSPFTNTENTESINIAPGSRNSTLYAVARELVITGHVADMGQLTQVVETLNSRISIDAGGPLPEIELASIARSAWRRGLARRGVVESRKRKLSEQQGEESVKLLNGIDHSHEEKGEEEETGQEEESSPGKTVEASGGTEVSHGGTVGGTDETVTEIFETKAETPETEVIETNTPQGGEKLVQKKLLAIARQVELNREILREQQDCIEQLSVFNQEEPYGSQALLERVIVLFGQYFVRVGGEKIFVFDDDSNKLIWTEQTVKNPFLALRYINRTLDRVTFSRGFRDKFGFSKKGEFERDKLAVEREKVRRVFHSSVFLWVLLTGSKFIEKKYSDFDASPDLLFCASGVLDMRTGVVRCAQAQDYLLRRSGVRWDPEGLCPGWTEFLSEVFAGNPDPSGMINYIQEIFGYTLSGSMYVQAVYCHLGSGANGKSTVLGVLKRLGGSYAGALGPDKLSKKNFDKFERLAAAVKGFRCAIIDDIETTSHWNEAFIKNITGKLIEARQLYQEPEELHNRAKFHMGLNAMPEPETASNGFFRRIRILNYEVQFCENPVKTAHIERMIDEEISGILRWATAGYQRFLRQGGFSEPEESKLSQQEYREESSLTDERLRELFVPDDSGSFLPTEELLTFVEQYCLKMGIPCQYKSNSLGRRLKKLFSIRHKKTTTTRGFTLKINPQFILTSEEDSIL